MLLPRTPRFNRQGALNIKVGTYHKGLQICLCALIPAILGAMIKIAGQEQDNGPDGKANK